MAYALRDQCRGTEPNPGNGGQHERLQTQEQAAWIQEVSADYAILGFKPEARARVGAWVRMGTTSRWILRGFQQFLILCRNLETGSMKA